MAVENFKRAHVPRPPPLINLWGPSLPANRFCIMAAQEGVTTLKEGVTTLKEGVTTLKEGVTSLKEGVTTLKEGLTTLKEAWIWVLFIKCPMVRVTSSLNVGAWVRKCPRALICWHAVMCPRALAFFYTQGIDNVPPGPVILICSGLVIMCPVVIIMCPMVVIMCPMARIFWHAGVSL